MAVVVITGSNSGFGMQGALAFARHGDSVYATMRDASKAERLQQAAASEGLSVRIRTLDVTRPATFTSFVEEIVAEAGRIDVVVNNAGILRPGALEDLTDEALALVMETNFFGPIRLTRAVLPKMRAQRSGYIIMISSLSGVAGLPGDVAYTASKFALEGAAEALRHEIDRWGIKVALIEAGMYATRIFDAADGEVLPDSYPMHSPYRALIESQLRSLQARLPQAFDPRAVGELMVEVAGSDGRRLRWPADSVAERVLGKLFGLDDSERDEFLRAAADVDWWTRGKATP